MVHSVSEVVSERNARNDLGKAIWTIYARKEALDQWASSAMPLRHTLLSVRLHLKDINGRTDGRTDRRQPEIEFDSF